MKRIINVKLTRDEAEGLMNAGLRGIEDLHDADGDEDHEAADAADKALDKLGAAMAKAWPEPELPQHAEAP